MYLYMVCIHIIVVYWGDFVPDPSKPASVPTTCILCSVVRYTHQVAEVWASYIAHDTAPEWENCNRNHLVLNTEGYSILNELILGK